MKRQPRSAAWPSAPSRAGSIAAARNWRSFSLSRTEMNSGPGPKWKRSSTGGRVDKGLHMMSRKVAEAVENPAKRFEHPLDVLREEGLSTAQKLAILESWEDEAHQLLKATEENMKVGESSRIDEIRKAIDLVKKQQEKAHAKTS